MKICGDAYALDREIGNLIGNAIAHGGGGEIVVRLARDATLEVLDKGPGVPPAIRETLSSRSTARAGTGTVAAWAYI